MQFKSNAANHAAMKKVGFGELCLNTSENEQWAGTQWARKAKIVQTKPGVELSLHACASTPAIWHSTDSEFVQVPVSPITCKTVDDPVSCKVQDEYRKRYIAQVGTILQWRS